MSQLPTLIEKSEPRLESALRTSIQKMAPYPAEAKLFHDNWTKLNTVVEDELRKITAPAPPPSQAGKRKRTSKKTRRNKRK
jgi:hypothetical protein